MVMITGGGGTLLVGEHHTLTCSVSLGASTSYTYQWEKNGMMLNQNSSTISFSPLREADVGQYKCLVSDGSMNTTSDYVVINVEGECNLGPLIPAIILASFT